ncbi:MAG: cyclic nucleotide-binding domain-containing protein [Candidatus Latescibacter sp.]|nr:cyclic nucleotide-binding domain-containing protein [Candidatus Latescibacter sp.]
MEDEARRTGNDHRNQEISVSDGKRRVSEERRAVVKDADRIIEFMKKIPLFKGFSTEHFKQILNICSLKIIPKDSYLCHEGDEASELFILAKGRLKVITHGDTLLKFIFPMELVGEIGVFTNVRRSASLLATEDSTVIRIHKTELFRILKNDSMLSNILLLNVIQDLADKLQEDNQIIEELRNKKRTLVL